ncbi:EmrB/QacA family drug resistance transporter, partial [Pseudomonas aeruginosa]
WRGLARSAAGAWSIRPSGCYRHRRRQAAWRGFGTMLAGLGALPIVLEECGRRNWLESGPIRTGAFFAALSRLLFVQRQLWG